MEVLLDYGMVTRVGGGFFLALFFIIVGTLIGILLLTEDFWKSGIVCLGIAAIGIMSLITIPECRANIPTNVYKYVIEITDENKYKELVDSGYSLDKLYENRDIYVITGDVLE